MHHTGSIATVNSCDGHVEIKPRREPLSRVRPSAQCDSGAMRSGRPRHFSHADCFAWFASVLALFLFDAAAVGAGFLALAAATAAAGPRAAGGSRWAGKAVCPGATAAQTGIARADGGADLVRRAAAGRVAAGGRTNADRAERTARVAAGGADAFAGAGGLVEQLIGGAGQDAAVLADLATAVAGLAAAVSVEVFGRTAIGASRAVGAETDSLTVQATQVRSGVGAVARAPNAAVEAAAVVIRAAAAGAVAAVRAGAAGRAGGPGSAEKRGCHKTRA